MAAISGIVAGLVTGLIAADKPAVYATITGGIFVLLLPLIGIDSLSAGIFLMILFSWIGGLLAYRYKRSKKRITS